jgi:hypothetical protein
MDSFFVTFDIEKNCKKKNIIVHKKNIYKKYIIK